MGQCTILVSVFCVWQLKVMIGVRYKQQSLEKIISIT